MKIELKLHNLIRINVHFICLLICISRWAILPYRHEINSIRLKISFRIQSKIIGSVHSNSKFTFGYKYPISFNWRTVSQMIKARSERSIHFFRNFFKNVNKIHISIFIQSQELFKAIWAILFSSFFVIYFNKYSKNIPLSCQSTLTL